MTRLHTRGAAEAPAAARSTSQYSGEWVTLDLPGGDLALLIASEELQRDVLPGFLARQRWFGGKGNLPRRVRLIDAGSLGRYPLVLISADGGDQLYLLPLAAQWSDAPSGTALPKPAHTIAAMRDGTRRGILFDAAHDESFIRELVHAMAGGGELPGRSGVVRFETTDALEALDLSGPIRSLGADQSNSSAVVGERIMVKLYRRLRAGEQPEIEIARFLTGVAGFAATPAFRGSASLVDAKGEATAFAAAFAYVPNRGDAWSVVLAGLDHDLATASRPDGGAASGSLAICAALGRRTGELHAGFALPTPDPHFAAEPVSESDLHGWIDALIVEADRTLDGLEQAPALSGDAARDVAALLAARRAVTARLDAMRGIGSYGLKIRIHGDYHLGQVLVVEDDVVIIDFEGEPLRPLAERRAKTSPLRDVAGMFRSFDYAAWSALDAARGQRDCIEEDMRRRAFAWRDAAARAFLDAYWPLASAAGLLPNDPAARQSLLELFLIQKAFYEVAYEAANRPAWLPIPVRGVLDLLKLPSDDS